MSNDISKIGAAAIAALKALTRAKADKKAKTAKATELIEERNELARPLLQQVHDAIIAGQSVNGQHTWEGWAKYAGWSKRALNYILNGRKPQTPGGNSSSRLKMTMFDFSFYNRHKEEKSLSMWADFDLVGSDGVTVSGAAVKLSVRVPGENTRETYDAVAEKMIALMKQARLWSKETAADFKKWLQEYFEKEAIKPTPEPEKPKVVPVKKLTAAETKAALASSYTDYKNTTPDTADKKPGRKWLVEYSWALDETAKAHPEWHAGIVKAEMARIERKIHATPREPRRAKSPQITTHKMQPDGKRTWCGKTPGDTLAADAPMSDTPTCRNCQNGENADILRKTQVTVVINDNSTDAPVPQYDREAYAKAETVGQKRCIIGSPENLKWHADLEYRRNNPVVDPNADDEFAGERD